MVQYKPSAQEIRDRKSYGQGSRARFDSQWAMSRPTDWYTQSYDTGKSKIRNTDLIKDNLIKIPAVTTDQNESRNMYQMLMNQIRGGGGAQLLDTSGIPAGARRTGRTLFTNPAKSQGFFGDVKSLFTGKNKAAVRAPVHNVFGNFGQKGKDFYKKEFPIESGLNTLMEKAGSMMPYASWLSKLLPKREKEIIPRNPMFSPENNQFDLNFDEIENIPFQGDDFEISDDIVTEWPDGTAYSPWKEEIKETDLMAEALKEAERQALKDQIMANPATTDFGNLENLYDIKANTFDPKGYVEEQMNLGNMPTIETGFFEDFGINGTPAANMDPGSLTTKEALKDIAKLYYDNGSDIDKFFFDMFGYVPDDKYYQEGWETWLNPQSK